MTAENVIAAAAAVQALSSIAVFLATLKLSRVTEDLVRVTGGLSEVTGKLVLASAEPELKLFAPSGTVPRVGDCWCVLQNAGAVAVRVNMTVCVCAWDDADGLLNPIDEQRLIAQEHTLERGQRRRLFDAFPVAEKAAAIKNRMAGFLVRVEYRHSVTGKSGRFAKGWCTLLTDGGLYLNETWWSP
jgi:hypothetical protein